LASCTTADAIGLKLIHPSKLVFSFDQSDDTIENDILKHTPIGSNADQVRDFITQKLYGKETAAPTTASPDTPPPNQAIQHLGTSGGHEISVQLRKGFFFLKTKRLVCTWIFSLNDRLIDVEAHHYTTYSSLLRFTW
jgi:hypothetical protein